MGCPDGFTLSGSVVCRKCNNGLAHLDQAVIDEFDMAIFLAGIPRKKGRPPEIRGRGNLIASRDANGPAITVNMESYPVVGHDGTSVAPYRGSSRNIKAKTHSHDGIREINYAVEFGTNPKFVRGLAKIAFSALTYFQGSAVTLAERFNSLREFVCLGKGNRHVFLIASKDPAYRNQVWAPYISESGNYVLTFRLGQIEFVIDLSPDEEAFAGIKQAAIETYGTEGWTTLPLDSGQVRKT